MIQKDLFSILIYFEKVIYSCDAKLNFQHHFSSHQCHLILQKSFEYSDLLLKKHFLILSMLKTVVRFHMFVYTNTFLGFFDK